MRNLNTKALNRCYFDFAKMSGIDEIGDFVYVIEQNESWFLLPLNYY